MRHCLAATLVAVHFLSAGLTGAQEPVIAIRDVTIIPGTAAPAIPNATIVIRGRRIAAAGPSRSVRIPAGARVIDGRGRFVIPGLIDTHAHLASSVGTPRLERVLGYQLAHGITGVREASGIGRERELAALRKRIESGEMLAPRL